MFLKTPQSFYQAPSLRAIPWLEHGFGTRHAQPPVAGAVMLRQVHSHRVWIVDGDARLSCSPSLREADALVTNRPGVRLAIRTADCFPVLLADPAKRVVAAVHAGWRGTAAGIVRNAVAAMRERFGSDPEDLYAAIGPGIGGCCYQVGPEVAARFQDLFPERTDLGGPAKLDLAEANRRQLIQSGLAPGRIDCGGLCTCCLAEEFISFRREGRTGRMLSVIAILS